MRRHILKLLALFPILFAFATSAHAQATGADCSESDQPTKTWNQQPPDPICKGTSKSYFLLYIRLQSTPARISSQGKTTTKASAKSSGLAIGVAGRTGSKIVDLDAQLRSDPVIYTKVTFSGQEIQPGIFTGPGDQEIHPGTPFQADENWLKNLSISLFNRTNKEIVRAELDIDFPDMGDGPASRPMVGYRLWLGQLPEIDSFTPHGRKLPPEPNKQPLSFVPGQTLVLYLADYLEAMQACVEGGCDGKGMPFAQVTRIAVRRSQFYFSDGMRWDLHGYGVPDSNHPGQFTLHERGRFFPGHPSQNWPPPTQPFEVGQHPTN